MTGTAGSEEGMPQSSDGRQESQHGIVTSDYRFVYMGPAGTRTALHADVLRTFSWYAP